MTTVLDHDEHLRTQIPPLVPWALIAGGALFFVGGAMHPEEDPPDVTLKEHLRVMYEDGNWYASHTLQFIGVALVAVALVALARSGALASSRQAQRAGVVAAVGAVGWAFGSFLHLIAATEADRIAADRSTPLTDALIVVETITVPVFCLGLVLLAVVGLRTGLVGNRTAAACALVGGVAYAVAGATFAFTDALDPLFPLASFIGVWAVVTGVSLHRRRTRRQRCEGVVTRTAPVAARMDLGAPTAASDRHAASPTAACGRYQRRVTSSARDELEELGASHAPGLGEGESFRKGVETATELHPAQQRPQLRSVPGLPRWAPDKLVAGRARLAFFPRSSRGPSRRDGWLLRRKRHAHGEARPARCVRGQLRNIPIGRVGLSRSERTVGRTGHVAVALRIGGF